MTIIRKRINNPRRYLVALHNGDKFYVAAPLSEDNILCLRQYGISPGKAARVPVPHRPATKLNADGRWLLLRDLPKKPRLFVHAFHLVDWHGNDHYGTSIQERLCYQRKLMPPTELAFVIENDVLYSPLLENIDEDMSRIKVAMNVILEMVGHCEIRSEDKVPALPPVQQYEVPWEILRTGTRDAEVLKDYIEKTVKCKSKAQQIEIRNRHEYLQTMKPEFYVMGTQNFFGYVVYGFPELNLYIFESNGINNATYMFRGSWEQASRMTKMEVLSGGLQEARLYHTEHWKEHISQLVADIIKEVA